jgi:hypothetical protein
MADTGPRGPQGPAGTSIDLPVAIANGGTGAITAQAAANALQVCGIGSGIIISDGADLNDYKTVGNYVCMGNATAGSLANNPSGAVAFRMVVGLPAGTDDFLNQEITAYNNGTRYFRRYTTASDSWGPWYKFEGTQV